MAIVEKQGGQLSTKLLCGHTVADAGPVFARHPVAGDMHKCPRCKRIVPRAQVRA